MEQKKNGSCKSRSRWRVEGSSRIKRKRLLVGNFERNPKKYEFLFSGRDSKVFATLRDTNSKITH